MPDSRALDLFLVFAPLSILSFGGGQAIVPEIQTQMVAVHGWLSDSQFADLFALSRAAPGPSSLIAALVGWQVAGFGGAVLATLGMFVPSSLLFYAVGRWWQRHEGSMIRHVIEQGLAPVAVGLTFAGAVTVLRAAHAGPCELATAGSVCVLLQRTKSSTYVVMGGVAGMYALMYHLAA